MDLEEMELKQKLNKLTEKISDKEEHSDEDFTSHEHDANQHTDDMKLQGRKQPYVSTVIKSKTVTLADDSYSRNELFSLQRVRPHDSIHFYFILLSPSEIKQLFTRRNKTRRKKQENQGVK